jgi:hypothetical protein
MSPASRGSLCNLIACGRCLTASMFADRAGSAPCPAPIIDRGLDEAGLGEVMPRSPARLPRYQGSALPSACNVAAMAGDDPAQDLRRRSAQCMLNGTWRLGCHAEDHFGTSETPVRLADPVSGDRIWRRSVRMKSRPMAAPICATSFTKQGDPAARGRGVQLEGMASGARDPIAHTWTQPFRKSFRARSW